MPPQLANHSEFPWRSSQSRLEITLSAARKNLCGPSALVASPTGQRSLHCNLSVGLPWLVDYPPPRPLPWLLPQCKSKTIFSASRKNHFASNLPVRIPLLDVPPPPRRLPRLPPQFCCVLSSMVSYYRSMDYLILG